MDVIIKFAGLIVVYYIFRDALGRSSRGFYAVAPIVWFDGIVVSLTSKLPCLTTILFNLPLNTGAIRRSLARR